MIKNNPPKKQIKLRIAEASQDDAYKGIARIDYDTMKILGLRRGDVISIKGGKETLAIVDRSYPADVGEGIIRIDGIIRKNAKTGVGELVDLHKIEIKEAKKITIAPLQENIVVQGDPEVFRRGLLGRAAIKGDIVVLGGVQRRKDLLSEDMGEFGDVFGDILGGIASNFGGMGFGGLQQLKFVIVNTNPNVPVVITENTQVVVNSKAIEVSEDKIFDVNYEDIGGLKEEIKKVREMIEIPLKHPEIFERLGVEAPKGVLLHGPSGTGKTLLAKAVANESEANFILLNGPEIMSKFYGESEKKIRDIFAEAEKTAPSIIFIDEIDAIAPKREDVQGEVERRVVSQLLTMMDGLKSRGKVVVMGATNRPNSLDPALRRPGRFDREVSINVPDKDGRLSILKIHSRNMPIVHFENEVAGKFILKKIMDYDVTEKTKIKSLESDIKDKENLLSENKKILLRNKKEVKEFNLEISKIEHGLGLDEYSDNSLLRKIKERTSGINRLKKDISIKEEENISLIDEKEEIKNKIQHKTSSILKVKEVLMALELKKIELSEIVEKVAELRDERDYLGKEDMRQVFLKKDLDSKNDKLKEMVEKLIFSNIVSRKNMEEIEKQSAIFLLNSLSRTTHGFVGADLESLAKEAAMSVLRRILPKLKLKEEEQVPEELLGQLKITAKDFQDALKIVRPSAMREVLVETPNVDWNKVGGLDKVKQELKEAVEWPIQYPESFKRIGIRPPKGILLYGPPGTGKTLLAKAVAKESEANFIQVKGPSLLSMWVGKSEEGVRKIFERARQVSPCVIFFDEIDSLAGKRGMDNGNKVTERVLNQMLAEMDGLEELNDITVIAATNRPDMLDTALLRPGRFDRILLVPGPSKAGRLQILKIHTKNMPLSKEVSLDKLAEKTEGFVGADLENLVREAAMLALRENIDIQMVGKKHFDEAMKKVRPSVTKSTMDTYLKIEENYLKNAQAAIAPGAAYLG